MSSPAPATATVSAPTSVDQTHTPTTSSAVVEFGSRIMALANRAADALSTAPSDDTNCSVHSEAFHHCLNSHEFDDMGKCHYYVDMLAHCCNNSTC